MYNLEKLENLELRSTKEIAYLLMFLADGASAWIFTLQ